MPPDSAAPTLTKGRKIDAAAVMMRPLATPEEYQACVALQQDIWGEAFAETVPASLLQVTAHVGGIAVGAFAPDLRLVGFVFGIAGVMEGELVHWSHMLGVSEPAREMGIGRRLKLYQRTELAKRGIAKMFWTFDPLQARNAHLNLNRLGVRVVDYKVNMYGVTASPLHYGLATDRLVVMSLTSGEGGVRANAGSAADGAPVLTPFPQPGDRLLDEPDAPVALIEIPTDFQELVGGSPAAALEWRVAARTHFQWAFRHRYTVAGFRRDQMTNRSFYVIARSHE
jgi:predicted GNAT superfamily acetyltransferase